RITAIAGLSADQIGKAEELANWDFIKASESAQEYRYHLARFPGGVTERFARARLEDLAWAGLGATPGLDQLGDFLAEVPQGTHAKMAADRRAALKQEQAQAGKRRREEAEIKQRADEEERRRKAETEKHRRDEVERRRQEAENKRRLDEAEAEKHRRDKERRKLEREAALAAMKERLHRWRGAAAGAAAAGLLLGVWIGLTNFSAWVPWAGQETTSEAGGSKHAGGAACPRRHELR